MECQCENIVGYDACYLVNNQLWIVMELCVGGSLNDLMKLTGHSFTEPQIAVCLRDILSALAYLHDHNRIHRDIKAGNVLLTSDGVAKLADFGVSGTLSNSTAQRHTVIGTPFWMAPEVIQETGHNYKADIWSLGITLIELAEGHPPLCNLHPLRAIFVIPSRPPPTLTEPKKWSQEMNDFLAACLTKDPNMRPTAKQLLTHPWLKKHEQVHGETLKPLIQVADSAIKDKGGREKALNALYDEDSDSGSGSAGTTGTAKTVSSSGSSGGDTQPYSTVQIRKDDDDEYGSDEDAPKKESKRKSASKKKKKPAKEEEYGTMVRKDDDEEDEDTKNSDSAGGSGDGSNSSDEGSGTVRIKKDKKKKKKKEPAQEEASNTVVVKKDVSSRLKEERLGTLARGDSPKLRAVRQELDDIDAKMVSRLQAIPKQKSKDSEMIAVILAARKA